jgi:hypothetical protein
MHGELQKELIYARNKTKECAVVSQSHFVASFCLTASYKNFSFKQATDGFRLWKCCIFVKLLECGDLGVRHDIGQLISHIPSVVKPCKPEVWRPKRDENVTSPLRKETPLADFRRRLY